MKIRDLIPNGSQKSFYGKAKIYSENGIETLYSYNTPIIRREKNGELKRLWGGWSGTTGRHIASFCGLNKSGFMKLPM